MVKPIWFNIKDISNPNGRWTRYQFLAIMCIAFLATIGIGNVIMPDEADIDMESMLLDVGYSPVDYEIRDDGAVILYAPE
ncbi:MAG: hypothetical protein Q4P13_12035 [Psychrobacter sp.]|nr:hypothetical protein [Psychrobacter sp.]